MTDLPKEVRDHLAKIGAKGGRVGGTAKKRGNAKYYSELVKARWAKKGPKKG